jgi:hypothetical protein
VQVTTWSDFCDRTGPESARQAGEVRKAAAESRLRFTNASWSVGKYPGKWTTETEENFTFRKRDTKTRAERGRLKVNFPKIKANSKAVSVSEAYD